MGPDAELTRALCLIIHWCVHLPASNLAHELLLCERCCQDQCTGLHLFNSAFPLGCGSGASSLASLHLALGVELGTFHSWLAVGMFGRDL